MYSERQRPRKNEEFTYDSLYFYIKKLLETLRDNNVEYVSKNTIKTYSRGLYNALHQNRDIRIPVIQKSIDDMYNGKLPCAIQGHTQELIKTIKFTDTMSEILFRQPYFSKEEKKEPSIHRFFELLKTQGFSYYRISFLRLYNDSLYRNKHEYIDTLHHFSDTYGIPLLEKKSSSEITSWYAFHKSEYRDTLIAESVHSFLVRCLENNIMQFSPIQFMNFSPETAKSYRMICQLYSNKNSEYNRRGNID